MAIFGYFVFFIIVGWLIGLFTRGDCSLGTLIILVITVFWAMIMGFWAIATFIELIIGFNIASEKLWRRKCYEN